MTTLNVVNHLIQYCLNIMSNCLLKITGFPIPNDPIYSGSVWGPNRGKGGDFGKSEEQVMLLTKF